MKIPLNRPSLAGREMANIRDALRRGQISGDGHYTRCCSRRLEALTGAPRVLLTSSCTHALELAILLTGFKPGQEVVCPSFTFPSTANAFVLRGLKPRFAEVTPETLNMDPDDASRRITSRTAAMIPVHYAGVPCEMDRLTEMAQRHGVMLIEDAAQALGALYQRRHAGTFGSMGAFSFHETKNCHCGEGGALVINDPKWIARAEILRQKGTDRARFLRGEVDKYTWVDVGSSFVPSELQSAYLDAQLQNLRRITARRRQLHQGYVEALRSLEARGVFRLPVIPRDVQSAYHLFYILLESRRERDRVMADLQTRGIFATFHYVPLHLSAMGRRFGYRKGDFPVSENLSERLLRLPFFTSMTSREQARVTTALRRLF